MEVDLKFFQHYMAQLARPEQKARAKDLATLSHLDEERLSAFGEGWRHISAERRRRVVGQLVELAEDDVTLDFNAVFLACLDDEDAQVRATAIQGLWEYEGYDLVQRLKRLLGADPEPTVRAEVALALGRFVLRGELGSLRQAEVEAVHQALRQAIADPQEAPMVKARAIEALGACSQEWVKEAIGQAYNGGDHHLRIGAIHAMGRHCDSAWLPILVRELASEDPEVRFEAATACGAIGAEEAVPHLALLLDDEDREVQAAAISALGQIGGGESKAILLERLEQSDGPLSDLIEAALAEADFASDPIAFRFRP